MAAFDAARGCYVVRVVYDGPGMAGKTTNLQKICEIVPATRRSEMVTPAELKGRTMFFDWLEVDGPRKAPAPFKLQLISVPGQIERNYRRRPLVMKADVVVFVCDSAPDKIPETMRAFARLRASIKQRKVPVPLVVQVNKQDVEGALDPDRMRRRLKLDAAVPALPACASQNQGVKETLATATRHALRVLGSRDLEPLIAELANPDALFDHVLTFEDKPHEGPVDAEELYVDLEDVDTEGAAAAAHLVASTLDDLEARARRGARKRERGAT
ncbi:MAG TPA: ADP-ribosylation factor-like protein [Polyangiaceae bacterium]|nr:ADP-ribosylation factor-like protein [Polyangiaceae bacterium]